ncbi:MAG: tRNA (adenosine(37)-N6)-threonylcarbamoyltransferase complex dimerization subunit type 1 TsaB [Planctomycetaceae bacterium]|nr:tRNA (adenosine(37)-N6)-threonylcarbamoyltransferase complex dimerization subunit type 1 TsaB [Planctomycetaceae bacterium]
MLILGLETSSQAGSVALLGCNLGAECDNVLSQYVLPGGSRSAQTLIPAIGDVLAEAGKRPADVGLVAVTVGPGSFTGLRVGVTVAKTFAYSIGCECLGVDTLEVVAAQVPLNDQSSRDVHVVLDAQRKELFQARFCWAGGELKRLDIDRIVPVDTWLAQLQPGCLVTGSGINRLIDRLPTGVVAVDPACRTPHSATVGRVAWRHYQAGRRDDLWKLAPKYLRPSAAEEKHRSAHAPREDHSQLP